MRRFWRLRRTSKADNARRPARKPSRPLGVEALEERMLLAAYTIKHTPYIQLGDAPLTGLPGSTKDQAQILWQTLPAPTTGTDTLQVQYRAAGTSTWTNSAAIKTIDTGVGGRINHYVTLVGLNYDTDYTYVVHHLRNGTTIKDYTSTFHTRLPTGSTKPFSFVAYGDSALAPSATGFIKVQSKINTTNAAFSLLLGDNAYESGSHAEFDARLDPNVNVAATTYNSSHIDYFAMGNHEILSAGGQPSRDDYASPVPVKGVTSPVAGPVGEPPEHNYSFDYGNVHFATFDSNNYTNATRLKNELDWLVADMQASTAKWRVVFAHHPLSFGPSSQIMSAFQTASVDLFLVGHDHAFHRNYRSFDGSSVSGDTYDKAFGVLQITAGEGGKDAQGFLKVDATSTALNMTYFDANSGAVKDSFSIGGTVANRAPTDIVLSPASVPENSPNGTVVGTLSAVDPDRNDTATFSLSNSAGGRFAISGNKLTVANAGLLDAETKCNAAIFVKATDNAGLSVQKTLSINVTPVNEFAPTGISLSAGSVAENARNGTEVGQLSTTDPDACETQSFTYKLLDDAGGRFAISGDRLIVADGSLLNHLTNPTHVVTVQTADSGGLTFEQDFILNVIEVSTPDPGSNQAPQVNAGSDQTVAVSGAAKLSGKVTDDGLPSSLGTVTTQWTQMSGPGTVTFAKPAATATDATFSAPGTYVLRLEASDGELTAGDDVTITVTAALPGSVNQPPQVNAGSDLTTRLAKPAKLSGKVKDDGLPKSPGKVTTTWTQVSGPGTVKFSKASSAKTDATFSMDGTYVLRLEASDGALTGADDLTIIVTPPPPNQAPQVNAGSDQTILITKSAKLSGKLKDDGLPVSPGKVTTAWTKVSGPGNVKFAKPSSIATTVTFDTAGTYVLRLDASDGSLSAGDELTVTVKPIAPVLAATVAEHPATSTGAVDPVLAKLGLLDLLFGV